MILPLEELLVEGRVNGQPVFKVDLLEYIEGFLGISISEGKRLLKAGALTMDGRQLVERDILVYCPDGKTGRILPPITINGENIVKTWHGLEFKVVHVPNT